MFETDYITFKAVIHAKGPHVGLITYFRGDLFDGILQADGSEYDPAEYPELDEVLRAPTHRWRIWRFKFGRREYPFGVHRLPDCTARVIHKGVSPSDAAV